MADEELQARVRVLEARLEALLSDLARTRAGGFRAMRDSGACPGCGGRSLFHFRTLRSGGTDGALTPIALTHLHRFLYGTRPLATLEAFACRTCTLVELHAIDFEGIVPDGRTVVALEPHDEPPPAGPFR